jgi:hypothetical protein
VRHRVFGIVGLILAGVISVAAQRGNAQGDEFVGTWTGTWDGAGSSGGFDLIVERPKDGPIVARVSVTGEPTYKATLSQVAFDGKKMTGKYEFPPSPEAEIVLVATFEGNNATGTWSLREKAGGTEVVAGNWNVTKK